MNKENIAKIARTPEDKLLLAKLWDKMNAGIRKNIPSNTGFLSLREQELARYLFGNAEGLVSFGGYEGAERRMLVYLPEYFDSSFLISDESPVVCLRATFYEDDSPSHRDFLGALMGVGITRESVGDICVGKDFCDFFVTAEIAPYLLQNFQSAGRAKLHLQTVELSMVQITPPDVMQIRDTIASLRLDSVIASGFRIKRTQAVQYITTGKVAINGLPCEKPDKLVTEGSRISVRGLGKIQLAMINGETKKGRISVCIDRFI